MFDKLDKRTCEQIDRRGKRHTVRLLPVRFLDRYCKILETTGANPTADWFASGRKQLRDLAMITLPPEFKADLNHLDFSLMAKLCAELFFGEENPDGKKAVDNAKEKRDIDCEFAAARMINAYPGYTLDTLLELPAPVFFRLLSLTQRVKFDNALVEIFTAVNAAVNGGKAASSLFSDHGGYFVAPAVETKAYTEADVRAAYDRMKGPVTVVKSVKLGQIIE